MNDIQKKLPFMTAVFSHLIFQGLVLYRGAEMTLNNTDMSTFASKNRLLLTLFTIPLVIALVFANLGIISKVVIFSVVSFIMGMTYHSTKDLREALLEMIGIFIAMVIAGFITVHFGLNLQLMGNILFFSLLTLIILRLITPGNKNYTKLGMLIFMLYIVYDTNQILQRNYGGDFVSASLDYFIDIINLLSLSEEN
jgi:FtsH-binding integral membrane protein